MPVVGVVDHVAFLEVAEFRARNTFDAEEFRLVELAGDERDHVVRDGVQEHGQDERHHAVAHDDAVGRAHFLARIFEDAGDGGLPSPEGHEVFDGLVGARQEFIGRKRAVVSFNVIFQGARVDPHDHGSLIASGLIDRIVGGGFERRVELFLRQGGSEVPIRIKDGEKKALAHLRSAGCAVVHVTLKG